MQGKERGEAGCSERGREHGRKGAECATAAEAGGPGCGNSCRGRRPRLRETAAKAGGPGCGKQPSCRAIGENDCPTPPHF